MSGLLQAIAAGAVSAAGSAALVGLVRRALIYHGILDRPNARSSHIVPTPRGGGIGLLPILLAVWLALEALLPPMAGRHPAAAWVVPLAAIGLAAVSWLDDLRTLGPLPRLAAQLAAALAAVWLLPGPVFQGLLPPTLDGVLAALGWVWFVNLFNFMDGIDGISGVETIAVGGGIMLVGLATDTTIHAEHGQALVMAGAAAGFLVWNWHPAKIFLGDIGSVALGYLLGWLLLSLAASGLWVAALILPLYYIADASVTLSRRLAKGEKVWLPHRTHFYQRAVQSGRSHACVSLAIAGTNILLVGLACLAAAQPTQTMRAIMVFLAVLCVIGLLGWMIRPGSSVKREKP